MLNLIRMMSEGMIIAFLILYLACEKNLAYESPSALLYAGLLARQPYSARFLFRTFKKNS